MFALRLLCPACIIHSLDLTTAEDIASVCKVPLEKAKLRAERMRELDKRNRFLTSHLKQKVYKNFTPAYPPKTNLYQ